MGSPHTVSERLRDDPEGVIGVPVVAAILPFRQFHFRALQLLVRDFAQDMNERVEPCLPLIVGWTTYHGAHGVSEAMDISSRAQSNQRE
jgi:hypothetical protein